MLDRLPLDRDATVLDLGAGTGRLTRILAERYAHVVALEPDDELRAILAEVVPEADVRPGVAERIPLADESVDGVFAGQSFHWFANDTALGEIVRVLRADGVFALLWNTLNGKPSVPKAYDERIEALRDERRPESPDERILDGFPLGERDDAVFEHEQVLSRDGVLALAASASWIAVRDDRAAILDELAALLPVGDYVFPWRCEMTWVIRTSD